MQPVIFKRAPPPEPTIQRYTIRSPAEADEPRPRLELNALRALGAILDKRAWWTKWTKRPEVQRQWMHELEEALVHANVMQVLSVWPRNAAVGQTHDLQTKLDSIAALTNQRQKKREIEELLTHVLYPATNADEVFAEGRTNDRESEDESEDDSSDESEDEDGNVDGEDDSEDETALDEDGNVVAFDAAIDQAKKTHGIEETNVDKDGDATMDGQEADDEDEEEDDRLADHKTKDPFGQVTWYVTMRLVQEKLQALAPADWTKPTLSTIIDGASIRANEEVVSRTCELILAVARADDECSMETVKDHVPEETREDVLLILQLHFKRIYEVLSTTMDDLIRVLDVVVARLALPAKDEMDEEPTDAALLTPGPVPHAWMSDDLIPTDLKKSFVSEIAVLENVPEAEKDWHPDSNGQVLDLIHPSLYCGVVGETIRLPQSAAKRMYGSPLEHMEAIMFAPAKSKLSGPKTKSTKFQWLPCEIDVDEPDEGGNASILTYINNLHPATHTELYRTLERIYSRFVPLFETVLSSLDDQAHERAAKGLYEHGNATLPCVPALVPPGLFETSEPQHPLRGTRCQVIIKVAEIHLTPTKPKYPGGSWHIEGTDAERIIATGLYYFGSDNIQHSRLSFRNFVKTPEDDLTTDSITMGLMYGLQHAQLLVQHVGGVTAMEDRCVVFPNIYQHKVEPFELADPTRPGVRKVLAFFLVDPTAEPIPSTAVVPPQQQEWIEAAREPHRKRVRTPTTAKPQVQDTSREGLSLEDAKINRIKLMAERSPFTHDSDMDAVFSLCEH